MKKQFIIPIILFFLGWGIFIIIDKRTVKIKDSSIPLSWSKIRKDKLSEIEIQKNTNNTKIRYNIKREQGAWILTYPINFPILQEKVILVANYFLTLTPKQKLTDIDSDTWNSYGLNNPRFQISGIFNDNSTNGFIIGNVTTIGNQYYIAELNNTNTVYIVAESSIDIFTQDVTSIVNTQIFFTPNDEITAVYFRNLKEQYIVLTNIDNFWIQIEPETNKNVDWGTTKFLLSIKDLFFQANTVDFDVSTETLKNIGVDENISPTLSLVLKDGTKTEIFLGSLTTNNMYPIYIPEEKIITYIPSLVIQEIFNTLIGDFQTKK